MENNPQLDTVLNKSTTLSIVATSADIDLSTTIWAINWFNTKRIWLYNLYTILASPLVIKSGGQLIFKGRLIKKIAGEKRDGREKLLIVQYPSTQNFLALASKKYFLFISILRILSVDRFVFGFTQQLKKSDCSRKKQPKNTPCLVHHFRGAGDMDKSLENIVSTAAAKGVCLVYAGRKSATIKRSHATEGSYAVPFFMDGIFVFEADSQTTLQAFYESNVYQNFVTGLQHSYAGIFEKLN